MKPSAAWAVLAILVLLACGKPAHETVGLNQTSDLVPAVSAAEVETASLLITGQGILEKTAYLADDALEGRGTGTAGELRAAQWIADQYKNYGLKPLGQDYFQKVELVGYRKKGETSQLKLKTADGELAFGNDETLTYWSTAQKETVTIENAPLLFVGYGVEAPEYQWDDYKGVDCTGKVLVFLNNDPQTGDDAMFGGAARTYYGRYTYKFEQAMRKGAAGAIIIHTTPSAGYGWSVIGTSGGREAFALRLPNTGYQLDVLAWVHEDLANALAGTVGATLEQWFAAGNRADFQPQPLPVTLSANLDVELRHVDSQNVVGVWEGSDPVLKNEMVVFSAHYDHLGMLEDGEGDRIYNGAWDNASGVASIMQIAEAFSISKIRPRRSVTFVACAAEEKGLLGSQWFVARPPVALKNLVANFNIDMVQIFGLTRDMVAIGHDSNSLGQALKSVTDQTQVAQADESLGAVALEGDQDPNAGSFYRSDQVNFAKAGIPALFVLPGRNFIAPPKVDRQAYHDSHYHQLNDEINDAWDLSGCERDMRVVFQLTVMVADEPQIPRWNAGNEFESAWRKLHGN